MKKRAYVGVYFFWSMIYNYINENIYATTLVHLENIGFLLTFLDLLTIYLNYKPKIISKINILITIILFASLMLLPKYTYKDAVDIVSNLSIVNAEILDHTSDQYKIGTPQIYRKGGISFFVAGEYLIYVLDKDSDTIICYKVSPLDGTYRIYDLPFL